MWRRAKARKWIHPVSYVLVAVASVLTFYGVVKISQHDFTKSRPEAIYIEVDGETLDRIQAD